MLLSRSGVVMACSLRLGNFAIVMQLLFNGTPERDLIIKIVFYCIIIIQRTHFIIFYGITFLDGLQYLCPYRFFVSFAPCIHRELWGYFLGLIIIDYKTARCILINIPSVKVCFTGGLRLHYLLFLQFFLCFFQLSLFLFELSYLNLAVPERVRHAQQLFQASFRLNVKIVAVAGDTMLFFIFILIFDIIFFCVICV